MMFKVGDMVKYDGYYNHIGYIIEFGDQDIKVQWFNSGKALWHLPNILTKVE